MVQHVLWCIFPWLVFAVALNLSIAHVYLGTNLTHPSRQKRSTDLQDLRPILPRKLYETGGIDTEYDKEQWELVKTKVQNKPFWYNFGTFYKQIRNLEIQLVCLFLSSHKYYDLDWRYEGKNDISGEPIHTEPVFMRQFPLPPLKELHSGIVKNCETADSCLYYIYYIAKATKTSDAYLEGKYPQAPVTEEDIIFPFGSREALFKFRASAMYYMCHHTMERRSVKIATLLTQDKKCPSLRHDYLAAGRKLPPDDWRNRDDEYRCATFSFCPDVCCGYRPEFTPDGMICHEAPINPCVHVGDGTCRVHTEDNINLHSFLAGKQLNFTCDCDQVQEGFHWHKEFEICVDTDECYTDQHNCEENEMCVNTPGSFICDCQGGYQKKGDKCVETTEQADTNEVEFSAPPRPPPPKEPSTGIALADDLKLLWKILSSTNSLRPSTWLLTVTMVTAAVVVVVVI